MREVEFILESLPSTGKMNLVELDVVKGGGPHNIKDVALYKEVVRTV